MTYILTSQSEGLHVALLEYGLNNKPVVSTEVGEIPLIITDGVNGFVVPKFDANAFCLSLKKLIEDEALQIKFGQALNKTIVANNSEQAVITNYINWLQDI